MKDNRRNSGMLYKGVVGIIIVALILGGYIATLNNKNDIKKKYCDLEWLAAEENHFQYKNRQVVESDENSVSIDFEMSGIDTIAEITVRDSSEIEFECSSQVSNGRAKVILVSESKEIVDICEGTVDITKMIPLEKGTYRIRLVGDNAAGKVIFGVEADDRVQVNTISNHIEFNW